MKHLAKLSKQIDYLAVTTSYTLNTSYLDKCLLDEKRNASLFETLMKLLRERKYIENH